MYDLALIVPLFLSTKTYPIMEYQGFSVLHAYLAEKGYRVRVIDAFAEQFSFEEVIDIILSEEIQWIGFTIMSSQYLENAVKILNELTIRKGNLPKVFLGGIYATLYYQDILENYSIFDCIVIGDGEKTITDILSYNIDKYDIRGIVFKEMGKIIKNAVREPLTEEELNQAPEPIHIPLNNIIANGGVVQIVTSRGCYAKCGFCAVNAYMKEINCSSWRALSAEKVVNEIERLFRKYSLTTIDIADDNFIGFGQKGSERAKDIARMLIRKNININFNIYSRVNDFDEETFGLLKEAGMNRVFIGVEFGVQSLLDYYGKNIKVEQSIYVLEKLQKMKIKVAPGYIMFEPMMSVNELRENLEFYYKYCDFKLNKLISKLEIYKNSLAYNKLKISIKINENPEFHPVFGDVCNYEFLNSKITKIFNEFCRAIPLIMPSKSYQVITDLEYRKANKYIIEWKRKIYLILQDTIDRIDRKVYEGHELSKKLVDFDEEYFQSIIKKEL